MAVHKRKVLLVGIDIHHAPFLVDRLRRHGHPLALADDGASGLLAIHRERPALVVAAARMPIMNGFQLLRVLREDHALGQTPVILVTDGDEVEEMARAGVAGADLCLSRHSSMADFTLCIERALRLAAAAESPSLHLDGHPALAPCAIGHPAPSRADERGEKHPDRSRLSSPVR